MAAKVRIKTEHSNRIAADIVIAEVEVREEVIPQDLLENFGNEMHKIVQDYYSQEKMVMKILKNALLEEPEELPGGIYVAVLVKVQTTNELVATAHINHEFIPDNLLEDFGEKLRGVVGEFVPSKGDLEVKIKFV